MNNDQALQVLLQAVQIAQQKGAFTLQDAKTIAFAVEALSPKTSETTGTPMPEKQEVTGTDEPSK